MIWHHVNYRLPSDAKPGQCQGSTSLANPKACSSTAVYGFTSINEHGDHRYFERCEQCALSLAVWLGIPFAGLREAVIFPIPVNAKSTRCENCNMITRWIITNNGNQMAVDPNGISHTVSCPGRLVQRRLA